MIQNTMQNINLYCDMDFRSFFLTGSSLRICIFVQTIMFGHDFFFWYGRAYVNCQICSMSSTWLGFDLACDHTHNIFLFKIALTYFNIFSRLDAHTQNGLASSLERYFKLKYVSNIVLSRLLLLEIQKLLFCMARYVYISCCYALAAVSIYLCLSLRYFWKNSQQGNQIMGLE